MASKGKSTFKLIISEITAVALNVIPLALWFFEDYTVETIVALYALESVLAMVFAVLCVLLLAPRERYKWKIIRDFVLIFGFCTFVILVFPAHLIFVLKQGAGVTLPAVIFGLKFILAFQLFEFFSNLYLLRPLSLKESEHLLSYSFGGMAVIFVSIFLGFFAAAIGLSVYLPFIVLKTFIDIGQPVQYFLGQTPSPTEPDPLFDPLSVKTPRKSIIKRNTKLPT
ncbi:MAG TPA: DUF6498-containing protein [Pyrinomonadaceae bacterium]|jgi:hypothetical protein